MCWQNRAIRPSSQGAKQSLISKAASLVPNTVEGTNKMPQS